MTIMHNAHKIDNRETVHLLHSAFVLSDNYLYRELNIKAAHDLVQHGVDSEKVPVISMSRAWTILNLYSVLLTINNRSV